MKKYREIRSKNLAGAFVFLGFSYEMRTNEYGMPVYCFERNSKFDTAFKDLHAMRMAINNPDKYRSVTKEYWW